MTKVRMFSQDNEYRLEAWEGALPEVQRIADSVSIAVNQEACHEYAHLEFHCTGMELKLDFDLYDLSVSGSPILESIRQSITIDQEDDGYDWWDYLPPCGVVQMSGAKLQLGTAVSDSELEVFFTLLVHFLLHHFMMVVFSAEERVCSQMVFGSGNCRSFVHEGQNYYRVKSFG